MPIFPKLAATSSGHQPDRWLNPRFSALTRDISALVRELHLAYAEGERSMPIINIVLILIIVGVLMWLVNSFVPMASSIKSILNELR